MSLLFYALLCSLQFALIELSSSKTTKYFVDPLYKGVGNGTPESVLTSRDEQAYPKRLLDIVRTFIFILSRRSANSVVPLGDDNAQVSEYSFPKRWWELSKGCVLFTSASASVSAAPLFQVSKPDGALVAPYVVRKFFDLYNNGQGEGYKFELGVCPDDFGHMVFLGDLQAISDGTKLYAWNEGGYIVPDYVTQVLELGKELVEPIRSSLFEYQGHSDEAVSKWLLSL